MKMLNRAGLASAFAVVLATGSSVDAFPDCTNNILSFGPSKYMTISHMDTIRGGYRNCLKVCNSLANCKYWSHEPATSSCHLFNAEPETTAQTIGAVSGQRECLPVPQKGEPSYVDPLRVDCTLHDISYGGVDVEKYSVESKDFIHWEGCQLLCQLNDHCFYFSWTNGACYLKADGAYKVKHRAAGARSSSKNCTDPM